MRSRREPPLEVYHYTSNAGLVGIVENRSVWSSDIRYLNDAKDYAYAFEVFDRAFDVRPRHGLKLQRHAVDGARDQLRSIRGLQTFVASFSEVGDLLSQWRGYCPPGQGVSVGFPVELLQRRAIAQAYMFEPCLYEPIKQCRVVRDLIERYLGIDHPEQNGQLHASVGLAVQLHKLAPRLKHPSFAEEREWRLISEPRVIAFPGVAFRQSRSFLVPYRHFTLTEGPEAVLTLGRITVGPNPHPELARQSINGFLSSRAVSGSRAHLSEVPYRPW